jgi:pimeloyl-ACP methyl ester carboxylesterase
MVKALLLHGMGRTPISQLVLASRLRRQGFAVHLFGYTTFRSFAACVDRLVARIRRLDDRGPFILVGHSLGCVMIRAALPRLQPRRPLACFFLAPPSRAPRAAQFFVKYRAYRWLMGEAGQLLADPSFWATLPLPDVPVKVYAGTIGFSGRFSPFRGEANDGILAVSETALSREHHVISVPAIHTFIMNSAFVAADIGATVEGLLGDATVLASE